MLKSTFETPRIILCFAEILSEMQKLIPDIKPEGASDAVYACFHHVNRTYLYNVVIKQQPKAMALHNGDIMSTVWTTARNKRIEDLLILCLQKQEHCSPS